MSRRDRKYRRKSILVVLIAFILVMIYEWLSKSVFKTSDAIHFYNVIVETAIISFIMFHFTFGFKRLYDYIIKRRFLISGILIIASTIIGYFENSYGIQEWILEKDVVLSLWWNIRFYALLLASYELFVLITNNKYIPIVGAITIAFSGFITWNFEMSSLIIVGELIVVLFDRLLNEESIKKQTVITIIIACLNAFYRYMHPSFVISFGYVFVGLIIWVLIKNKDKLFEDKTKFVSIGLLIVFTVITCIFGKRFVVNTTIMQIDNENGVGYLFSYLYNVVLPFKDIGYNATYGSFFSIFPIPMLISLYYLFKYDDHAEFLLPVTFISVIEVAFCISGFPEIISKITLLNNVRVQDVAVAANFANVLLMFYMVGNIYEELFSTSYAMRITAIICVLITFVKYPEVLTLKKYILLIACELAATGFTFLNFEDKNYKKAFLGLLTLIILIGGVNINKITYKTKPVKVEDITIQEKESNISR